MGANPLEKEHGLQDRILKSRRLMFDITIAGHATAASKTHTVDLPGVVYLRTEGKTSEADAIEDLSASFTTPVDATNATFGILIKTGAVRSIRKVELLESAGIGTTVSFSEPPPNADLDRIIGTDVIGIDCITMPGVDLASETVTYTVIVDYVKA